MKKLRPFIGGWWHAGDLASAAEQLHEALRAVGISADLAEALAAINASVEDEDEARRHQIGVAARFANAQLATLGHVDRVRAFGESADFESDEPVWLIVTPAEHAELLSQLGPSEDIERTYDEPGGDPAPPITPKPKAPRLPKNPAELWLFAKNQIDKRNYPLALEAIDRLLSQNYGQDDVVLVELERISTLRSLNRHAEAISAWNVTADAWLAGARNVWRSQWVSLEKLHKQLKLLEGPQLAAIHERIKTAPQ